MKFFFILIIAVLGGDRVLAQSPPTNVETQIWLSRAESIADNIIKDAGGLSDIDKALIFAQLGDIWWKIDSEKSSNWFEKSVDKLFFLSSEDRKASFKQYLETSRKVLLIVGSRSDKQRDRLVSILGEIPDIPQNERELNADALIETAKRFVEVNPLLAFQMAQTATRLGSPRQLFKLILELNRNRSDLAVQLFYQALGSASTEPNFVRLQTIQLAAFPSVLTGNYNGSVFEAKERVAALRFFANYIRVAQLSAAVKPGCAAEARLIDILNPQYLELLPGEAALVQAAVRKCLGISNESRTSSADPTAGLEIEELLKLADERKDNLPLRASLLSRAALLARDQKKYELSIKILDGMSDKERSIEPEMWDDLRADVSGRFALALRVQGDPLWDRILQDTPPSIRAFAKLGVLKRIASNSPAVGDSSSDILTTALVDIRKSEKIFPRKLPYWFGLLNWAGMHGHADLSIDAMRDLATAFNEFTADKANADFEIRSADIGSGVPEQVLQEQDARLLATIRLISKPRSRINIYFSILTVAVKKCGISVKKE